MPKHVDETSKHAKETYPQGTPKTFTNPSGTLNKWQQIQVAKEAWNRQENKSVEWDELDGERQRNYYDVSVDIYERGGGHNEFELKVQEVKAEVAAGTFVFEEPVPPDQIVPLTEYEKRELIAEKEKEEERVFSEPERLQLIREEEQRRILENRPKDRLKAQHMPHGHDETPKS